MKPLSHRDIVEIHNAEKSIRKFFKKSLVNDMREIIKMHYHIEKVHWEELGNPEDHIFLSLNNIKNYLMNIGEYYDKK